MPTAFQRMCPPICPLSWVSKQRCLCGRSQREQLRRHLCYWLQQWTYLQYFLRNARNGSFILATADLFGMVPVSYGSCAFASGAGGASASAWMDIFSVGVLFSSQIPVFNYMKNNRNGTFTNLVNSSAAFPGGVPTGCYYSSMVAADLNGDGRDDLFYNGYKYRN
jgi:hypothetical protein